jgi:hypothetical protein
VESARIVEGVHLSELDPDDSVASHAKRDVRTGSMHAREPCAKKTLYGLPQAKIETLVLVVRPFGPIFRLA